jgi:ribosomal protein L11 methyltransferase
VIAFELTLPAAAEDAATLVLWEHGTAGAEVRGRDGDDVVLLAYFEPADGLEGRLQEAVAAIPGARLRAVDVPQVDWVARFREGFHGFSAGGFRIAPCWDVPTDAGEPVLVVDPGQAFGTGTHESTRLCLRALERIAAQAVPQSVLDVGTGSGILGIAAALRGARRVAAVDVDPETLGIARRHAALNGVELRLVHGDGAAAFRAGRFDLVFANISAAALHEVRDEVVAAAAPGGRLVLSGFLDEEAARVAVAYEDAGVAERLADGEWSALVVQVPGR